MSVTFLALGSLGLLALLAGPILAHLTRQTPVERRAFGAMPLLERLLRRTRRHRRLRDWLLLALRLLALALVVLGVTRPALRLPEERLTPGSLGRLVVVLDDSLSMGQRGGSPGVPSGPTLLAGALDAARALLDELPDDTEIGIVLASGGTGQAQVLLPALTAERAAARTALDGVEPGFGATDLAGALLQARALLAGEPGEVVVLSDEAGPGTLAAALVEVERLAERGARILPRPLLPERPANAVVRGATYGEGLEGGSLAVCVVGFGADPAELPVTVVLPGGSRMTAFAALPGCPPAGGEPTACPAVEVAFTVPPEVPGGVGRVEVGDGLLAGDDSFYFHIPRVGASRVLVVDGEPGPSPIRSEVYFLERALAPWGLAGGGITPDVTGPAGVVGLDPDEHRVVFLCNVGDPRPIADTLSSFVRQGGSLVITAGDNIVPQRYNAALGPLLPAPFAAAKNLVDLDASGGVPLLPPDETASGDLLAPFSDRGRGAFTRMAVRRLLTFDGLQPSEEVRIHLRLANGLPLLVERRVGRGRVLVLCGTVDLAWGNLPLQAAFLPLVQRLVAWLGAETGGTTALFEGTVGAAIELPLPAAELDPVVEDPDGQAVPARRLAGRVRFVPLRPGAYRLALPGAPPLAQVAVNTPPEESDVRRYGSLAAVAADLTPVAQQRRVDLAPWALGLGLALLLIQAPLGGLRREA
ncbi:MAG: VWA domain-containing protein [Pseudomonadota bacterium]